MRIKDFIKNIATRLLRKTMKVGVSYNVFDGEELLEASINCIRSNVQHISVVYQITSNFGNPASSDLKEMLERLSEKGLIDELYYYEPDIQSKPHKNEKRKRNIGLKLAQKAGCTHFMSMDTDEFYDSEEFKKALDFIALNNIATSAVSSIEYLKSEENQLAGGYIYTPNDNSLYNFYVPFVIKIKKFGIQKHGLGYFPCYTDPTRKLTHSGKFKLFSVQDIVMHHMSTVRKDLSKKFDNTSMLDSNKKNQDFVNRVQNEVINFDFDKNRVLPQDYSFFRDIPVRKVPKKFNIDIS